MVAQASERPARRLHFGLLLLISFVLFNLGYAMDQAFRWTNHFDGFLNGVCHSFFYGTIWLIFLLPWSLLIGGLYRWRRWKRFRTFWVLAPAGTAVLFCLALLIHNPPTPARRFSNFARTDLPAQARNLKWFFSGGGLADYVDLYFFETTPDEVERLIAAMQLEPRDYERPQDIPIPRMAGYPDYTQWEPCRLYERVDEGWGYYLLTDAPRIRVCVYMFCY